MAFWSIGHILNKIFDSATSALNMKVTGSNVEQTAGSTATGIKVQRVGGDDGTNVQSLKMDATRYLLASSKLVSSAGTEAVFGATSDAFADGNGVQTNSKSMGFNGTTWDRLRSVNTGQLVVTLKDSAGDAVDIVSPSGDAHTVTNSMSVQAYMEAFNNTNHDRWRNNTEGTLLASAARTAAATAPLLTNYNAVGILVILDVTVASGTGGLQVKIRTRDTISVNPVQHNAAPTAITATGRYGYLVYPGASTAGSASSGLVNQSTAQAIGRSVDVIMDVGDASSYTYSLSYALIV